MSRRSKTRGICRIDQPEKHNHGFFMRLQRGGKIYSAFFTDIKYGGKAAALAAAEHFYRQSVAIFGPPPKLNRQWWAEIQRRKGASGIVGVQRAVVRRRGKPYWSWRATWSPEPYVTRRKFFSIRKYGAGEARQRAIRARRAGVRSMKP